MRFICYVFRFTNLRAPTLWRSSGSGSGSKWISYCHLTARRHIAYKLSDYAASSTIDMGKCEAEKTEQFILQNYLRA